MKCRLFCKLLLGLVFVMSFWDMTFVEPMSALDIIKKADEKMRGESSYGEMTMTIVRPDYSRSISMKTWSKGINYSMVLITAPAKEKGQVFLKINRDMWNWVPSIERMIKIPPSMMMQSWMGSDFTNDDLVRQSSIVKDYKHRLLGEEEVRGKACYKLELIAKEEAPVVWGKIWVWITKDGYDQWQAKYFDEDGVLVNSEYAYNMKKMGSRTIPTKIEIIPADKSGHKTVMEIINIVFDLPMEVSFFTQQNMKRLK